ncbi:polysaccharide biosynthesis protein [Sphaerospermopsis aphanizomenoides BCCUSP55]|uniref:polysaccharide biosynthesis protein n=1 Tax=Sphaerospermopsis aphanizomenoides TaxID=459663 RepID=UPI00190409D0|nr:polysaccharide biosynthesis protein [Sphaerospermopsis aphanizomenoides]MBK1988975.1 polysaccharide biosynthesis protein [Sphaerospermopsis aphanizomenoides BCCUSP55]
MSLPFLPPRFFHWTKVLSKFVSIQILVQALTLASGVFIVRTLSQQEYAYYTIANSMLAVMNVLSDSGISTGLSAIGGKVWQDSYRFGQLIKTAMQLRYFLAAISVTVVTPILIWMLIRNGTSLSYAVLITIAVLIGLNFQLTNGLLIVVPRLYSQISQIQYLDVFAAISRLIFMGLGYLSFWNGIVAIASASLVSGLQRLFLGRLASQNIVKIVNSDAINEEDRKFIISTIKHSLPNSIFFCIQGQLSIFIISIFGSTTSVAELGALGRIGVIFAIINSIMTTIVLPGFSRCQSLEVLRRRYFQILGIFGLFGILMIAIVYIFPEQIIWILGNKYSHLRKELLMIVTLTVVNSLINMISSLNLSKAWIEYGWIDIPITLTWQAILLMHLNISTLQGVIIFTLFSKIPPLLLNIMLSYRGFANYKSV